MKAVFAETFYWAALTSTEDAAHERAMDRSRSSEPDRIVTTDEVLAEYLAFFASARPSVPVQAGSNVANLIKNPVIESLLLVWTASQADEWRNQIAYLPFR